MNAENVSTGKVDGLCFQSESTMTNILINNKERNALLTLSPLTGTELTFALRTFKGIAAFKPQ